MNKNQTLEAIQNARKAHLSQMDKIVTAMDGNQVDNPTVLNKTQCEFGKWLYADENHLQEILGALFFNNLETIHAKWHMEYSRLFDIFFKNQKKGLFSKFFRKSKVDPMELDKAKLYYTELSATTAELLKNLGSCERRVNAMNESKFH